VAHVGDMRQGCATRKMISLTHGSAGPHRDRPGLRRRRRRCGWPVGSRVLGLIMEGRDASGRMDELGVGRGAGAAAMAARLVDYTYYYCYPTLRPLHKRTQHVTAARRNPPRHISFCCLRPLLRRTFLREPCARHSCNCQTDNVFS
jgi:hypothetical protein